MAWLLLIVSRPPHPSSLRVRVWRRLRALGAVGLKNSVHLLPATDENQEQFQWLSQVVKGRRSDLKPVGAGSRAYGVWSKADSITEFEGFKHGS